MNNITERLELNETDLRRIQKHVYRYKWASKVLRPGDEVIDVACGTGYGKQILESAATLNKWVGLDKIHPHIRGAIRCDLETGENVPSQNFDVFIGLETIEHLIEMKYFLALAKRSRRAIVISTPIIPTVHFNKYHRRDFYRETLEELFEDNIWKVTAYEEQESTYGLWVFKRRVGPC